MDTFELIQSKGLEQLVYCHDEAVGLRGVIAVHNTLLGPALAPVRMRNYATEHDAIADAVNMARNMTYRTAIADCDLGGGSCIIWGDPKKDKSEALFRSFGRFLERFGGQLYAVMGMNTTGADMHDIKRETDKVIAQSIVHGGIADPVQLTADGIFQGLRATARELKGKATLKGINCLVQGLGRMGSAVVERLVEAGANIVVTDLNYDRIKNVQDRHPSVTMVRPEAAFDHRCDIIVPCAPPSDGGTDVVKRLRCKAIAGASCFVVLDNDIADALHKKEILYMPHYLLDCGEAILADYELKGVAAAQLPDAIAGIYGRTRSIQEAAKESGECPQRTAVMRAQSRLKSIGNIGRRNAW